MFCEQFRVTDVSPGDHLINDLGADDLDFLALTMAMEEEFDLEITESESFDVESGILKLPTVNDWVEYIDQRLKSR